MTRGWKFDGVEWACSSNYHDIGAPGVSLATNVAYYVIGDSAQEAHTAKIVLNINNPRTRSEGLRELGDLASTLFATFALQPPTDFLDSVRRGQLTRGEAVGVRYALERETTRIETLRVVVSRATTQTARTPPPRQVERGEFHLEITKVLAANGVRGCGQYRYEATDTQGHDYVVHCTSDGERWKSYFVSTRYRKVTPLDTGLTPEMHARRQAWEQQQAARSPMPEDLTIAPRLVSPETPNEPPDPNRQEISRLITEQEKRQEALQRERSLARPQLRAWVASNFLPRVTPVSRSLATIRAALDQDFRRAEHPCKKLTAELAVLDESFVRSCPDPIARRALADYVRSVREVEAQCNAGVAIRTMEALRRAAAAEGRLSETLRTDG